ncbi:DUF5667 domain-containing protein [Chloroflexota bacterium]
MKNRKEFDNILEECLERIIARGETIEQCLANYPEQADELKPLLETSLATKNALAIEPRSEFRDRARHQLRMALQEMTEKKERRVSLFGFLTSRWATAVAMVLVILLAGSGTVAAAGNSMPDQTLYPVKLATERVRMVLTVSALGKAELYAALADKRVAEIVSMAEKGKLEQVERTARRLNTHLEQIVSLALPSGVEAEALLAPAPQAVVEEVPPEIVEVEPADDEANVMLTPAPLPPQAATAPSVRVKPSEKKAGVSLSPAPTVVQEASLPSAELAPAEKKAGVSLAPVPATTAGEAPLAPAVTTVVPEVPEESEEQAKLREIVIRNAARYPEVLRQVLEKVPESARPALRRAIADSEAKYEEVLRILRERKGRD